MTLPHIIKQGHRGVAVSWVQRRLKAHGYNVLVDGQFGTTTKMFVTRFQKSHRLPADGIVGPQTQKHLREVKGKLPKGHKSLWRFIPTRLPQRKNSVGERAVAIMEQWAGRRESPGGSNRVPSLVALAKRVGWSAGIYSMGYSWCDFGVHLALKLAKCKTLVASGTWGGYTGMYVPNTRKRLDQLVKQGKAHKIAVHRAARGDIAIMFNEGHIGFVRNRSEGGRIPTMECNTSSGAAGSQSNGDGCYKRYRTINDIDAVYRLV